MDGYCITALALTFFITAYTHQHLIAVAMFLALFLDFYKANIKSQSLLHEAPKPYS